MKQHNTIFISRSFYPIEGGIQTYLRNVAERWDIGDVCVYCGRADNIPDQIKTPLKIQRYSYTTKSYLNALIIIFKLLFNKPGYFFKKLKFFLLLICSRSVVKNIAEFTKTVIIDITNMSFQPNSFHCSVPIYTGLVGVILKFQYNGKLIIYIHGSELLIYGKNKLSKKIMKYVFSIADVIISNSNYTKELAVEIGADQNKIKVVNLGANTQQFYPIDSKEEIYKKYNIPVNHKLLYTISHLIPRKGNDMVIKAMKEVVKSYPDVTYLIGGKGTYKTELQKLIIQNKLQDNVKFAGFIADDELNKVMNACDVYVMPNRKEGNDIEGYGIVFMEANACKKPVIAGRSGGAVDAVIDGKTGFLVDPESIEDITKKVLRLLMNDKLRIEMGDSGYKFVTSERNWDKVAKEIKRLVVE